ncbi:rhomboid family intramembrane serine protease [Clostridium fallax]|uniref:Rhomboid family protein n=1 Tax=Clostridium fallax TaxID=1533 RepID=A0A1M4Y6G1_9CLOT|nr:rhomboid family intramembrane serine protease [Clostridium fallax]SHF01259.1 Rhomboid family protein [Clostridium fallax]SQB07458.1 membrane protein [Clostridium fallax]
MKFLNKLERKYGKYAIRDLMKYIVILNLAVYLINYMFPSIDVIYKLAYIPELVLKGQVWRIVTFLFIPPDTSLIFILFVLYFYYFIGLSLEQVWGSFKFNIYYLVGALGTIIAATIIGGAANPLYLNFSLFLAYAYFYPNNEVYLFFIIPIKVKYLAYLDLFFLFVQFFKGGMVTKVLILVALLNCILFFGKDIMKTMKSNKKAFDNKRRFENKKGQKKEYFHKCYKCGITDKDDPNMEFRYCSECDGHYEYCMKHLHDHFHIKKGGKN